jgi:hypothetical protein
MGNGMTLVRISPTVGLAPDASHVEIYLQIYVQALSKYIGEFGPSQKKVTIWTRLLMLSRHYPHVLHTMWADVLFLAVWLPGVRGSLSLLAA